MQACKEYMIRACFAAVSFSKKADLSAASKNNKTKPPRCQRAQGRARGERHAPVQVVADGDGGRPQGVKLGHGGAHAGVLRGGKGGVEE